MAKILLLGSGELGKEFVIAAQRITKPLLQLIITKTFASST
jgi:formate-dependent phosphoribosylglycinamide formyltransferase (GAR transformylase)